MLPSEQALRLKDADGRLQKRTNWSRKQWPSSRVALGDVDIKLLIVECAELQFVEAVDARQNARVDALLGYGAAHLGRLHLHYADVHVGMVAEQRGEEARQQVGRYGGQHAHGECARQRFPLLEGRIAQAARPAQHLLGAAYHLGARTRGLDGLTPAVEDAQAQFILQLLYHRTKRGLGHLAVVRRAGEVLEAPHSHDIFQLLQCHSLCVLFPRLR